MFAIGSIYRFIISVITFTIILIPADIHANEICSQLIESAIISKPDTITPIDHKLTPTHDPHLSIYDYPYSKRFSCHDWRRLWINTGVLAGAYFGTLGVLQLLPEDATAWNRAEITSVPAGRRWWTHVKAGPEWDHDNIVFNYILHPYAGAAYYMAARSCGFNLYQSFLYCACISTIGWEYGVEAFMEYPSWQDLFVTPIVGSFIGECFYKVKRNIVTNGYRLAGSKALGNVVAFLIDPVNEVIGIFAGNPCRQHTPYGKTPIEIASSPWAQSCNGSMSYGFSVACQF
jgi:hypothetical protein